VTHLYPQLIALSLPAVHSDALYCAVVLLQVLRTWPLLNCWPKSHGVAVGLQHGPSLQQQWKQLLLLRAGRMPQQTKRPPV
jgi:hypothetical protein